MKNYLLKSIIGQATLEILSYQNSASKDEILFYVSNNLSFFNIDNHQMQVIRNTLNRNNLN